MAMIKQSIFLILATVMTLCLQAQDNSRLEEAFFDAEYFLLNGDYSDALPYYQGIYSAMPENAMIAYRIGLCYLNIEGKKNLSIGYLERASEKMTSRFREGVLKQMEAPYDALYFLGDAYRINYQFEKAIEAYTRYRGTLLPDDVEDMMLIDQQLSACHNAPEMMTNPVQYSLDNLGPVINDGKDNFMPVISADGKSMVYMTSMKFYDAIMFTKLVKGIWTPPINITPDLQSDGDQYVSCLSANGNMLVLTKNDDFNSDLYTSNFDGLRWEPVVKMRKDINTKYWESHGFISEDGKTLVLSSDRPGGFGGLDLYISKLDANGNWGTPVNMGPDINTALNEDRPFLINNGKMIFFTSQGHYSMGGYDIFSSELQSSGIWSPPLNLGYPLNTPDDNTFFCPTDDGRGGFISLTRDGEGYGKADIYKVRFK
jgi:hypothetical protein